jgi:hypothetical protein
MRGRCGAPQCCSGGKTMFIVILNNAEKSKMM